MANVSPAKQSRCFVSRPFSGFALDLASEILGIAKFSLYAVS
jgi:hypothetical protein